MANGARRKAKADHGWMVLLYMTSDEANLQEPARLEIEELGRPLREKPPNLPGPVVWIEIETPSGLHKRCELSSDGTLTWLWADAPGENPIKAFVDEAADRYRGRKQVLVLWGHSAGVGSSLRVPDAWLNSAPPGKQVMHVLDIGQSSGQAAAQPPMAKVDLLVADTCFMGGIEWVNRLQTLANWLLAPQGSIGIDSMPFDSLIEVLLQAPGIDAEQLGRRLVDQVDLFRRAPSDLVLYRLDKAAEAKDELHQLARRLLRALAGKASTRGGWPVNAYATKLQLVQAIEASRWSRVRQLVDLRDLTERLSGLGWRRVRNQARKLLRAIDSLIVDRANNLQSPLGGISIYCPWVWATDAEVEAGARNLDLDERAYAAFEMQRWHDLMYDSDLLRDALRRNLERQLRQQARWVQRQLSGLDTTPWGMDTKPWGMDTKPWGMDTKPWGMDTKPGQLSREPRQR